MSRPHILPCILAVLLPLSLLIWVTHSILTIGSRDSHLSPLRCFMSILAPCLIFHNAARKKKLDSLALVVAFIMGFVETLSNACMIATTTMFFFVGTKATSYKLGSKNFDDGNEHATGGRRNWIQVVSNGGVGLELAILMLIEKGPANEMPINFSYDYFPSWLSIAFLGSMSCACGDTLASELSPVLTSSSPRLIINPFRKVPKGTNGGITLIGLLFSLIGGLICGFTYYVNTIGLSNFDLLMRSPPQWPLLIVGAFAGLFGSVLDSLIGATLQFSGFDKVNRKVVSKSGTGIVKISGYEILDNHSVNLLSTLLTALLSPFVAKIVWENL